MDIENEDRKLSKILRDTNDRKAYLCAELRKREALYKLYSPFYKPHPRYE
jgi:hypothetical protein